MRRARDQWRMAAAGLASVLVAVGMLAGVPQQARADDLTLSMTGVYLAGYADTMGINGCDDGRGRIVVEIDGPGQPRLTIALDSSYPEFTWTPVVSGQHTVKATCIPYSGSARSVTQTFWVDPHGGASVVCTGSRITLTTTGLRPGQRLDLLLWTAEALSYDDEYSFRYPGAVTATAEGRVTWVFDVPQGFAPETYVAMVQPQQPARAHYSAVGSFSVKSCPQVPGLPSTGA